VATVALTFTGLSQEAAQFQARSAFTGTGFTTSEAETVVDHPVRRRIIMTLMLLRSAGIVTILLSLILSFVGSEDGGKLDRLAWLVGGVVVLWVLSLSGAVDRFLKRLMTWAVKRWTDLDVRDYVGLLKLSGDYVIREMQVEKDDWLAGKELSACRLREEGVSIVGIYRSNGNYVGVPKGNTAIHPGDTLVLYGRAEGLQKLDRRRTGGEGDRDHSEAVGDEQRRMDQQDREEAEFERSKTQRSQGKRPRDSTASAQTKKERSSHDSEEDCDSQRERVSPPSEELRNAEEADR
jgi:NhaP-type Na+/H+ and K+/H+ antiporter